MAPRSVSPLARLALGALVLAAACGPDNNPSGPAPEAQTARPVTAATLTPIEGRYIVLMKPGQQGAMAAATANLGAQVERAHAAAGIAMVRDLTAPQLSSLAGAPGVEAVVPDMGTHWIPSPQQMFSGLQQVADPGLGAQGTDQSTAQFFAPYQWNMKVTQANLAWTATPGGQGRTVCVLDSGVDPGQLDLIGKVDLSKSASMVATEPFIEDLNLHGTFVSGLISSRGIGMASTAPDVSLCAVKVLDVTGFGSFGDIINGIIFAASNHVDVINMSLGAYVDRTAPGVDVLLDALQRAINIANDLGVVVVTSSGNSGINLDEDHPNLAEIPAQLRNVVAVGATAPINQQNFDLLASYSNFGGLTGIQMVAPGGDLVAGGVTQDLVISACSRYNVSFNCTAGNNYLFGSGTSFASPMVAGAAAVIRSALGNLTTSQVAHCLMANTDNVGNNRIFGRGRLNVLKAAACANH